MAEPCGCGGYDCKRCGPLQGSSKCDFHGEYGCESCEEHLAEHGHYPEPDCAEFDPDDK